MTSFLANNFLKLFSQSGPTKFSEFPDVLIVMFRIRGFGDFFTWYMWLGWPYKIVAGLVIFGVLYLIYLFFAAMFADKHI